MTRSQNIGLLFTILLLLALFVYIIFSPHGYSDLALLKKEQSSLVQKNERLTRENLAIRIEIDRLKHDLGYIENIARQEFGMIRKDEIILKPQKQLDWKK
jgi:cell division protein FtsB